MKAATLKDIQTELGNLSQPELVALCLRLARFKKENKELLTYLLFEAFDEQAYIDNIKKETGEQFEEINTTSLYFVKKSARKILRTINKFSRYSGSAEVEIQLLMHFCILLKASGVNLSKNQVLLNIYQNQLKKIEKAIAKLHEDLQYDYLKELAVLNAETVNTSTASKIISYFKNKKHAQIKTKKASS
jgi:hypothetical protein